MHLYLSVCNLIWKIDSRLLKNHSMSDVIISRDNVSYHHHQLHIKDYLLFCSETVNEFSHVNFSTRKV